MPVHRIILRLDFSTNFDIVDKPGVVMRMMKSVPDELLTEIRETTAKRQIIGHHKSDHDSLTIVVEPTSINFTSESLEGFDLQQLENSVEFSRITRLVQEYYETFHIAEILRIGFRFFAFDSLSESKEERNSRLIRNINGPLISCITETLGNITDCGFAFDGNSKDGILFHLRFGPFSGVETKNHLIDFSNEFDPNEKYDSILDLDLYEMNVSTPKVAFKKYLKPFLEKASTVIKSINSITSS